jgi:hypothetical protein
VGEGPAGGKARGEELRPTAVVGFRMGWPPAPRTRANQTLVLPSQQLSCPLIRHNWQTGEAGVEGHGAPRFSEQAVATSSRFLGAAGECFRPSARARTKCTDLLSD